MEKWATDVKGERVEYRIPSTRWEEIIMVLNGVNCRVAIEKLEKFVLYINLEEGDDCTHQC